MNKTKPMRVLQIATAAPLSPHDRKPFLFGVIDDGDQADHVWFWDWNTRTWRPLTEINT